MIVKFATVDDIDKLVSVSLSWGAEMNYEIDAEEVKEDHRQLLSKGVIIFLEDDKGEAVAYLGGSMSYNCWNKRKEIFENFTFVKPDQRGKGYSKVLIASLAEWGKEKGASSMILAPNYYGSSDPTKASELLFKQGFKLHGFMMRKEI